MLTTLPDELWALVEPSLAARPRRPYGGRHRTISDRLQVRWDRAASEVVAEELGPSLRWATATTTRTTRNQDH